MICKKQYNANPTTGTRFMVVYAESGKGQVYSTGLRATRAVTLHQRLRVSKYVELLNKTLPRSRTNLHVRRREVSSGLC